MSHSWSSKVDGNQGEIVEALRAVGCSVALTHRIGGGFPDILVGYEDQEGRLVNVLMEVKVGKAKLNEREQEWHEGWRGQVAVVRSKEEALFLVGFLDEEDIAEFAVCQNEEDMANCKGKN